MRAFISYDIPGNKEILELLQPRLDSRSAIAFTGAGTSAELYPLWPELIKNLVNRAFETKLIDAAARDFWLDKAVDNPLEIAKAVKEKLGAQHYAAAMRAEFAPRMAKDGRSYTKVHSALLRMPFRGFVTTNYDSGLLEARQGERPGIVSTGYCTWQDRNDVQAWLTDEIFQRSPVPILFAHGVYERPETVILTLDDYRAAYQQRLYQRVFDKLWTQEHLVITGFSFSDPWLKHLCEIAVADTQSDNAPRHIAIIGLRPDQTYTPEMRQFFLTTYNANVIFYPVELSEGRENHHALIGLLEQFTRPREELANARTFRPPTKFRQEWVHETTNDSRYVGRKVTLDRLDRWAADPGVRVISITGLGGLGKTALVGHWLRDRQSMPPHQNAIFFWSFYAERAVKPFLERFIEFTRVAPEEGTRQRVSPVKTAIEALYRDAAVLILDGLEVLQEQSEHSSHGRVLEDDLRELIDAVARTEHQSLVILTSRFPFVDLTPYFGSTARNMDLDRLLPIDGAELLFRSGVRGTNEERETASRRLEGHPLALRLFAAALATQGSADPSRLWIAVFGDTNVRDDSPLWAKLDRLLAFYEQHLPPEQRAVLAFVALFAMPVEDSIIRPLVRRSLARSGIEADKEHISAALRRLVQDGLLLQEHLSGKTQYSCHPILRDHFRSGLISSERQAAVDAADILTGRPAERRPTDVKEIIHTLNGVELLIEAEQFRLANDLFMRRFRQGQIFMSIPAIHEGARCAMGFVETSARRELCRLQLGRADLIQYLNRAGFFSAIGGEPERSILFFREAEAVSRHVSPSQRAVALRNLAAALTQIGKLEEAEAAALEAMELTESNFVNRVLSAACLAELGYIFWLRGKLNNAFGAFKEAAKRKARDNYFSELASMWEVKHALALLRIGKLYQARAMTEATLKASHQRHWQQDVAACHVILGRLALIREDFQAGRKHFDEAESIMRRGHLLADLGSALLAQAVHRLAQNEFEAAERFADEALRLASSRKLLLLRSEALCIRAQILVRRYIETRSPSPTILDVALDSGEASLNTARSCGYLWAECDAHEVVAEAWKNLRNSQKAESHSQSAAALKAQLKYDRAT